MSDSHNNIFETNVRAHRICRVAYTINNEQPVLCTIIGSQPLFYMDHEDASYYEDEMFLEDAADLNILSHELDVLRRELDCFESFSDVNALSSEEKVQEFFACADDLVSKDKEINADNLVKIKNILVQSRLACAYFSDADEYDIDIEYSSEVETAEYDRRFLKIFVNPDLSEVEQILLIVQEMRRHSQHRNGALINPLTFHPDNAILVNRMQSADLAVSMVRVAWELQLAGYKDAWTYIENSSMADLGRAFAREAYLDFRTINNGQAMAAVFEAWFLSERCRTQDKILINQMLADHQGIVFDHVLSEVSLTPSIISALGCMPFGKNYLAEHAMTIMDDAIFTEVRDRSNANFLWFIKFERTFRETEQELQIKGSSQGKDVSSFAFQSEGKQDKEYDSVSASSAQIISLGRGSGSDVAENGDKTEKKGKRLSQNDRFKRRNNERSVSNVVYLRSWSGE